MNEITKQAEEARVESNEDHNLVESRERRDAIRKLGKYAAYVAPAVIAMTSTNSSAGVAPS